MTTENTTDISNEDVSGLKTKNADLVRRLKLAEQRAEAAELEAENALDTASTAAGDELSKLQRAYNKLEKQVADLTGERDTFASELRTTRVDNEVAKAIASSNVRPELVPAVEALLLRQATYEDGVATINGKTIADAAKSFFSSKDGSHYVRAPESSGSGSTGASAVDTSGWSNAPSTADEYTRYMKLTVSDPAAATSLADKWNRPDLKP